MFYKKISRALLRDSIVILNRKNSFSFLFSLFFTPVRSARSLSCTDPFFFTESNNNNNNKNKGNKRLSC